MLILKVNLETTIWPIRIYQLNTESSKKRQRTTNFEQKKIASGWTWTNEFTHYECGAITTLPRMHSLFFNSILPKKRTKGNQECILIDVKKINQFLFQNSPSKCTFKIHCVNFEGEFWKWILKVNFEQHSCSFCFFFTL